MGSSSNPLTDTDHAIRIVDQGTLDAIVSQEDNKKHTDVQGYAPYGEKAAYITSASMDLVPAIIGKYAYTGLTENKERALGALTSHELGHSASLGHVPALFIENPEREKIYDQNLMHIGGHPSAGMKLLKGQILQVYDSYNNGLLNRGRQRIQIKH